MFSNSLRWSLFAFLLKCMVFKGLGTASLLCSVRQAFAQRPASSTKPKLYGRFILRQALTRLPIHPPSGQNPTSDSSSAKLSPNAPCKKTRGTAVLYSRFGRTSSSQALFRSLGSLSVCPGFPFPHRTRARRFSWRLDYITKSIPLCQPLLVSVLGKFAIIRTIAIFRNVHMPDLTLKMMVIHRWCTCAGSDRCQTLSLHPAKTRPSHEE